MADWPDLAMFKQALGGSIPSTKDDLLEQALGAAIESVVTDCGGDPVEVAFGSPPDGTPTVSLVDASPAEDYVPIEIPVTDSLAAAALLLAVSILKAPDAPFGVASTFDTGGIYVARHNPNYTRLLKGHRQRFGIA
jgi:hypothetical protein